jgi:hypothetical protein
MPTNFVRRVEDFKCEHCGADVKGNGYTNHCPRCLWSKHVDITPGDRAADCGGMMEPVQLEGSSSAYRILHRCETCGGEKWNQAAPEDDFEKLLALASAQLERTLGMESDES